MEGSIKVCLGERIGMANSPFDGCNNGVASSSEKAPDGLSAQQVIVIDAGLAHLKTTALAPPFGTKAKLLPVGAGKSIAVVLGTMPETGNSLGYQGEARPVGFSFSFHACDGVRNEPAHFVPRLVSPSTTRRYSRDQTCLAAHCLGQIVTGLLGGILSALVPFGSLGKGSLVPLVHDQHDRTTLLAYR